MKNLKSLRDIHRATFPAAELLIGLGLAQAIEKIERLGDHEVRFTLRSPNVTFLSTFAMSFASIHSAEYAGQLLKRGEGSLLNRRPVGTGPYKFKERRPDQYVLLTRFDSYSARAEAPSGYSGKRTATMPSTAVKLMPPNSGAGRSNHAWGARSLAPNRRSSGWVATSISMAMAVHHRS